MTDSPKLIGSLPIHRRYTDPAYEPRPGSRLRAIVDMASRTAAPFLLGIGGGTFIAFPLEDYGWTVAHGSAIIGAVFALGLIGFAIVNFREIEKDADHRHMYRRVPASLILPPDLPWGLGLTELQVSRAVELKWELDALDRSQKDGISDGYLEKREELREQMLIVLTSGPADYPDPRKD